MSAAPVSEPAAVNAPASAEPRRSRRVRARFFRAETLVPLFFFAAYFILGCLIFDDYAVFPDEQTEHTTAKLSFDYMLDCFREKRVLTEQPIHRYRDRFYGTALQFPPLFIEWLKGWRMDAKNIYLVRHLWVFLNSFFSQICSFLLFRLRFKDWKIALAGAAFFILSPRLFGESFYNNKDAQFTAWFTISLFCAAKLIFGKKRRWAVWFGLSAALAVNTRFYGGIPVFLLTVGLVIAIFRRRVSVADGLKTLAAMLLPLALFWLLLTPAAWSEPFRYTRDWLLSFTQFEDRGPIPPLYLGKLYQSNELPRSYLPLWMLMTEPIWLTLLSFGGFAALIRRTLRLRGFDRESAVDLLPAGSLLLVLAFVILTRPIMYDGWRHFHFLGSVVIYFAVAGLDGLRRLRWKLPRLAAFALCAAGCALTGVWMIRNHPYEMVYFIPPVRKSVPENFSKDYWRQSSREALEFVLASDDSLRVEIWDYDAVLRAASLSLDAADRERLSYTSYGFGGRPAKYLIANYTQYATNQLEIPFYQPVKHIEVDGIRLASVFERVHENEIAGARAIRSVQTGSNAAEAPLLMDGDAATAWVSAAPQGPNEYVTLGLDGMYELYGLSFLLSGSDNEYPHSLMLDYSEDGEHWSEARITTRACSEYTFEPLRARYLRLRTPGGDENYWNIAEIILYGKK